MRFSTACCALAAVACAALAAAPLAAAAAAPLAAAATVVAAAAAAPGALAAATSPLHRQLDVCSLHYATDAKKALASMELSYRAGMCVVAARTVGATCDPLAADEAVLLGPFACDAPVGLAAVSARLAADAARRASGASMPSASPSAGASALAGPALNAWVTVQGPAAPAAAPAAAGNATVAPAAAAKAGNATAAAAKAAVAVVAAAAAKAAGNATLLGASPSLCSLTLQEPTKLRQRMARAPDARLSDAERLEAPGAAGRSSFARGAFALSNLGCRAGVSPARASVDAAADAMLGGPAEQRRPFTFGLWVAPEGLAAAPTAPGAKQADGPSSCRLVVSAQAPVAERMQAMARSAVAGDAFLGADAVTCEHFVPAAEEEGLLATGCCYAGR